MTESFSKIKDFTLSAEEVSKVFIFDANKPIKFDTSNYQNVVCENFLKQYNHTVNIKTQYFGKKVTVRLYCAAKACDKKYKIQIERNSITMNEDVSFTCFESKDICDHTTKLIRPLSKEKRREFANKLDSATVVSVRNQSILSSDKELLESGNLQEIYSQDVLRKVKSQNRSKNDKQANTILDLIVRSEEMKFVDSIEYKSDKFSVNIISLDQIYVLNHYIQLMQKKKYISRIFYDATGGICCKPSNKIRNLLHHVLVIPVNSHPQDSTKIIINIGEMITSLHTTQQQEIFLRRFINLARQVIKRDVLIEEIVTDFSWAAINAISLAFNNMKIVDYINRCFDIIQTNDKISLKTLCVIKLCSSHLTKNIQKDIRACFQNLSKEHVYYISSIIGALFNISENEALDIFLKQFLTFLMEKSKSSNKYINAIKLFSTYADSPDIDSWIEEVNSNQSNVNDIQDDDFDEKIQAIYKSSHFYQKYSSYTINMSKSRQTVSNIFYNPSFVAIFLKKYIAYIPFWSQILTKMRSITLERANNGFIEGYFGHVKNDLKNNGFPLGKIKLTRYVEYIEKKIEADCMKIKFEIPGKSTNKKTKEENITQSELNQTFENWKQKGNSGSSTNNIEKGIFFNKQNLKKVEKLNIV